jgi:polar amino acid transport system substrate-binding protein
MRRIACLAALAAALAAAAPAAAAPATLTPGVLAVSLSMPSAGFQVGSVRGSEVVFARGLEVDLAKALARRMGLRPVFTNEPSFTNLIAASPKPWDVALAQVTITAGRRRSVDFSLPYLTADEGVLLRRGLGKRPRTVAELRSLRLCVEQGTTGAATVARRVRPTTRARSYADVSTLVQALGVGRCDAIVYDAPTLAVLRARVPRRYGALAGVIRTNERYGIVMADASPLTPDVNRALTAVIADGTLEALSKKWLSVDVSRLRVLS